MKAVLFALLCVLLLIPACGGDPGPEATETASPSTEEELPSTRQIVQQRLTDLGYHEYRAGSAYARRPTNDLIAIDILVELRRIADNCGTGR